MYKEENNKEEKKDLGLEKLIGGEEVDIEDLCEVSGGLTKTGEDLLRRRAREYKHKGLDKESYFHIIDEFSPFTFRYLQTTRAELLKTMNKIWYETR